VIDAGATRIVLEQRSSVAKAPAAAPPQRLIVTHNVVQISRAPLPASAAEPIAAKIDKPRQLVAITVHPDTPAQQSARHANVPVWRRNRDQWRTIARTTTTSVTETAPETLTHSAESIQVSANYPTREVAPVGGETAINPQPPMIAYSEGAEGTTVYEVRVDERGMPTKCVITKSAGYPVLDEAVCKAAMKARYTPKTVDGRAVPGVYHDAFTFHMSDQAAAAQGIQQTIPAAGPASDRRSMMDGAPPPSSPFAGPGGGR
jgi:TonB family protein